MIVSGLRVREDLCLEHYIRLNDLARDSRNIIEKYTNQKAKLVQRIKNWFLAYRDLIAIKTEFISILSFAKFPILHVRKVSSILEALNLNGKSVNEYDPGVKAKFDNIAIWMAVHLGITPQEALQGTTIKQAESIYYQYEMKRLMALADSLNIREADYNKYHRQLQGEIRKAASRLKTLDSKEKLEPPKIQSSGNVVKFVKMMVK